MRRTLVTAFAFLFTWAHALDATAEQGPYLEINPGLSFLADSDLSGGGGLAGLSATAGFDTGWVIGAAVGYRLDDFRGELNFSYRESDIDDLKVAGGTLDGIGKVSIPTLMANVYYDINLKSPVTPYLGAGIGVGFIDVDSQSGSSLLIVNDDATEFAWNIMVGASYRVFEGMELTLGYRYLGTLDPELNASIPGIPVSGKLDAELTAHELVFGVRLLLY